MNRRTFFKSSCVAGVTTVLPKAGKGLVDVYAPAIAIAINQSGYQPTIQKIASIRGQGGGDQRFRIYSEHPGGLTFQGNLGPATPDKASGDLVSLADFSTVTTPGVYFLDVQGARSAPFVIGKECYTRALTLCMRSYYGQRCGCTVDLGDGYHHAACHLDAAYHPSSGRSGQLKNRGGWHDAGDYGRYMVNAAITVGTLLWAWELYPISLRNLALKLPESGGRLPDYLADIRWKLEWMLTIQDEDGGVWHKQTSEQFCPFILPENDPLVSFVIGTGTTPFKSSCATADFAAVMAIAARVYRPYDAIFAGRCLTSAKSAWQWVSAHPLITFRNPPGIGTGAYADSECKDETLWASAELWRTTGDAEYQEAFLAGSIQLPPEKGICVPSWGSVSSLAYWTYALAARRGEPALKSRILAKTSAFAQTLLNQQDSNGYGNTLSLVDFGWGSNSVAANQSMLLLVANHFEPNPRLVSGAWGNLHYILGRNCFGISWVTQLGTNSFQNPHHRLSFASHLSAPWPGLLSGGPNSHPADKAAQSLPQLPPMRMWVDDHAAYSVNEVAINWNAPLVFLLAAINSLGR